MDKLPPMSDELRADLEHLHARLCIKDWDTGEYRSLYDLSDEKRQRLADYIFALIDRKPAHRPKSIQNTFRDFVVWNEVRKRIDGGMKKQEAYHEVDDLLSEGDFDRWPFPGMFPKGFTGNVGSIYREFEKSSRKRGRYAWRRPDGKQYPEYF